MRVHIIRLEFNFRYFQAGPITPVLITVAFYVNEMDEGELGHDEHVI